MQLRGRSRGRSLRPRRRLAGSPVLAKRTRRTSSGDVCPCSRALAWVYVLMKGQVASVLSSEALMSSGAGACSSPRPPGGPAQPLSPLRKKTRDLGLTSGTALAAGSTMAGSTIRTGAFPRPTVPAGAGRSLAVGAPLNGAVYRYPGGGRDNTAKPLPVTGALLGSDVRTAPPHRYSRAGRRGRHTEQPIGAIRGPR